MSYIHTGTLNAVNRYLMMLDVEGVKSENHATLENGDTTSLEHIKWMLEELNRVIDPTGEAGFPVDKFSRWLGFIQGVLICKGLTDVNTERNITRPWFNKSEPS